MKYYLNLPKYFINLDRSKDRYQHMEEVVGVMKAEDVNPQHPQYPAFIRFPAIDASQLSLKDVMGIFDVRRAQQMYQVVYNVNTYACGASHFQLMQSIAKNPLIKDDDWVLITEDDNSYVTNFPAKLNQLLEHLDDERFEHLELVILRMFALKKTVDYFPCVEAQALQVVGKGKDFIAGTGLRSMDKIYRFPNALVFHACRDAWPTRHLGSELEWSETYTNKVKENISTALYSNTTTIFYSSFQRCYCAGAYLVRKKACKRITSNFSKPFWIADDFMKVFNIARTLFVSPFMAYDSVHGAKSNINHDIKESEITVVYDNNIVYDFENYKLRDYLHANPQLYQNLLKGNKKERAQALAEISKYSPQPNFCAEDAK